MRRVLTVAAGLVLGLELMAPCAVAQWMYPGGYGGYGMGGWGGDPMSMYMTGLGSYARGRGVYTLDRAKAKAIDTDTAIKWNKELRARQRARRAEQKQQEAEKNAEFEAKTQRRRLVTGAALNDLLDQIYDGDPGVGKAARARAPISPQAIREIPFEWDSEAITACIDELSGTGAMPSVLMDSKYADERNALRKAVEPALKEDAEGDVSSETRRRIHRAVADLRAKFLKNSAEYEPGHREAVEYLTTLASLNRLLSDPSMKKFLAGLEEGKERTVGDLITFMNAYNLRFGPTSTDRQIEIYERLLPQLTAIRDELNPGQGQGGQPARYTLDKSGEGLRSAAKSAFSGMSWGDLEAHSRDQ